MGVEAVAGGVVRKLQGPGIQVCVKEQQCACQCCVFPIQGVLSVSWDIFGTSAHNSASDFHKPHLDFTVRSFLTKLFPSRPIVLAARLCGPKGF